MYLVRNVAEVVAELRTHLGDVVFTYPLDFLLLEDLGVLDEVLRQFSLEEPVIVVVVNRQVRVVFHGKDVNAVASVRLAEINLVVAVFSEKLLDILLHAQKSGELLHAFSRRGIQKALVVVCTSTDVAPPRSIGIFVLFSEKKVELVVVYGRGKNAGTHYLLLLYVEIILSHSIYVTYSGIKYTSII